MTDATTTSTATGTTAATTAAAAATGTTAATPWHQGQADADTLGYWQNKGYDTTDPAKVAIEATKAARALEKSFGVPADRLLKLPEKPGDEGWKAVYQRLGAPADPKEYDFSTVKHADGSAPAQSLIDAARAAAAALHAPKDRAADIATAMVKHLDAAKAESDAAKAGTLAEQKAKLAQSWGANAEMNRLQAMQGAKRLGITPEAVAALEQQIGYDGVMEAMRKIGAGTTEDTFVESGTRTGTPATTESAQQRLTELTSDPAWGKRLASGDVAANREFKQLTGLIAGVAA
jgi:hypothetical protein